MSSTLRRATRQIQASMRQAGQAAEATARRLEHVRNASRKIGDVGKSMSLKMTAPIVGLGALTIRSAAQFEQSMNRVGVLTNATGGDFNRLRAQARNLGKTTQYSATQAAEGMGFLAMAGFKTEKIIAALPGTLQLAASAQMDLGQAADTVTNIMSGYGFKAESIGRINDVLVKTFTSSNTDLQQLGVALKYSGSVAKGAGIKFEEAAAALGLMGSAGYQGSMAGTALRGALSRLLNPSREAQKVLSRLGIKKSDIKTSEGGIVSLSKVIQELNSHGAGIAEMMTIFGDRAGPAFQALAKEGAPALDNLTKSLETSGGIAKKVSEAQMKGATGELRRLTSAFEGLQLTLADAGLLRWFTDMVKGLTRWISALSKSSPMMFRFVSVLALILAVVGPLLMVIGQLGMGFYGLSIGIPVIASLAGSIWGAVTATWAWTAALLANPISWVVIGILAVIAALVLLWRKWGAVTAFVKKIGAEIEAVFYSGMMSLVKYLLGTNMVSVGVKWIGGFVDGVVAKWRALTTWLSNAIAGLTRMIPDWVKKRLGISAAVTTTNVNKSDTTPSFTSAYRGRHSAAHATVGGELHIKIDSDGRPHVKALKSDNPNFGINVDAGLVMGGAG
ncbi:phage tail tape measure protein [Varunaivibrio sulfuroxidans]|nr:phage tail tape measure protein [Varunaivibrio sulfuroxidans]WES30742.1 phage tail tape measure protein [Varunaivibrio sulfuroxidans]